MSRHIADKLEELGAGVRSRLGAKHEAREQALTESRRATRASANAIRATHRDDRGQAQALMDEAAAALDAARTACADQPAIRHAGFVVDAEKEYAEARTTFALIAGSDLPSPDEVGVDEAAWLNGLAETVGELRRHVLDLLRGERLDRCEELLAAMDEIYGLLVTVDFPEGVTGGLRRSTDAARGTLERTRGDLATARGQERLRRALETHRDQVLGDDDQGPPAGG